MIKFVLENFDTIFKSKDSLENLDKLILDLAIKGKLVEQNPNDEPASELLKRIKEEKQRLIDEKVIKKEKPLPPIEEDEKPFKIPSNWEWVRLGEVINVLTDGTHSTPKYQEIGVPFLSVKNMSKGILEFTNTKFISEEEHKELSKRCKVEKGDLLLTKVGTTGIPVIVDTEKEFSIFVSVALLKFNKDDLNVNYLKLLLQSPFVYNQSQENTKGVGNKNLVLKDIANIKITLPPVEEQKRIVEKVEKLQQLTKKLKEIYISNEDNRQLLKKSVLLEIENSGNDKELLKNLEIVFSNFDKIVKTKEDIKDIRNLILSLAIKGKLVEQNPNDEPASELLKRIKEEKQRLIDEKVIKKEKPLPPIEEDEKPFKIPSNWEWVRLGDIITLKGGKRVSNGYKLLETPTNHIYIRITDMKNYTIKNDNLRYIDEAMYQKIKQYIITKDDLYITIAGTIGYVGEVPEQFDNMNLTENAGRIILYFTDKKFLRYLLNSQSIQNQFNKMVNKMAQPKLALTRIQETLISLPPVEEQKRIVEKIENLMKICDLLESKLIINEKISENLLKSINNN